MSRRDRIYDLNSTTGSRMHKTHHCVRLFCLLVTCLMRCVAQGRPAQNEIDQISNALRGGEFAQALALSRIALASRPSDYRIWTLRGIATAKMGDIPSASMAYQHALRLAPYYLPALEGAAQSEFQLGHEEARPLLLKVLMQRPDDPTSHAMLGVLEYRRRNCADAATHFQEAVGVIASQPHALVEYGACLTILKRDEEAIAIFAQVLAFDPMSRAARYNLALSQWNAHHANEALATLQPLTETSPVDGGAATIAAEIFESEGDTPHAVESLRKTILGNPKDVDAYLRFAALSYDHDSPRVGIDFLNAGLRQLPGEPRLLLVRGILLTQIGEFDRAADDFDEARKIDPKLEFLGIAEGLVKSQQHMSEEALAKFRAAVKDHPNEAFAQYLLAEALQLLGKPKDSPEHKEEVQAVTLAVKLDPRLVVARDLLSSVYFDNGQTDLAIEQSRDALAIDPNDQQAVYHLIIAFRKTGKKDQIPPLLKRLVELRSNTQGNQETKMRYRLDEAPTSTGATLLSTP